MTETQARQKIVGIMQGWVGRKEADGTHKVIIDIYNNGAKPLPRSYRVTYKDAWCATTVSAAAIQAGFTEIIPIECSCGKLIELAKIMRCWQEDDAYVPMPGDFVIYDWDDGENYATTDNTGYPEHIGTVEKTVGNIITVIEGNIRDAVGRRTLKVNGRYIRGYIVPQYSKLATVEDTPNVTGELKVGDLVKFIGNKHFTTSYVNGKQKSCKPGLARVTAVSKKKPHPYHLVAVAGGGSNVHGWADAADIEGAATEPASPASKEIKVGDIVTYSGTVHYTSSYASGKARNCRGGKAKVTQISKGKTHPYHLESAEKGCTVHGWTDADKVKK